MGLRIEGGHVVEDQVPPRVQFYEAPYKVGVGQYETRVYLKLQPIGYRDIHSRLATEKDKADYADAWEKYQSGLDQEDKGTPLSQLPAFKAAFGLELADRGIETVEDLAVVDEPAEYLHLLWKQAKMFVKLSEVNGDA